MPVRKLPSIKLVAQKRVSQRQVVLKQRPPQNKLVSKKRVSPRRVILKQAEPKPEVAKRDEGKIVLRIKKEPQFNPICPMCENIVAGDMTDYQEHVDFCLEAAEEHDAAVFDPPRIEIEEDPTGGLLINVDGEESRYGRAQYGFEDLVRIAALAETDPVIPSDLHPVNGSSSKKELLERISGQRAQLERAPRCLICLDLFSKPVVSTACWHVCCEACWARILTTKRLCPQCSRITSPADLRRLFI